MPNILYLDDIGVAVLKTLIGEPTDEQVTTAVSAVLAAHPEWTTTVQDGSITGPKIANDTIPDAKLAQTGGVLSRVAALESDVYSSGYVDTPLSGISTKLTGHNATVSSGEINVGTNAAYDSYIFIADEDMQVYVDASSVAYYAVCIGTNPSGGWIEGAYDSYTLACESAVRLRKNDGNLPSVDSPLTIAAGTGIAVTVTAGYDASMYVYGNTGVVKIGTPKVTVSKTDTSVRLSSSSYSVIFSKIATTQGYQWNITSLIGQGGNVIPSATDMIGVLQFVGKSNFMGGVHGNEDVIDFKLYANGAEVADGDSYDEIHLVMNSHLYDVDDNTQNVVDRYVNMVFTPTGWTCRVTFKVLIATTIQVAYPSGLFGFVAADASEAFTNVGAIDLSSTVARPIDSPQMKEATVNLTDNLTLTIRSETGDKGFIVYRSNTQSFKVYFANASEQQVSVGDFITGRCEYKF